MAMGKVFCYSLALVSGLTLVLPPGWCYFLLPPPAAARERAPAGPRHDCCPEGGRPQQAPADSDAPPCPCSDRDTTLLTSDPPPVDGLPAVIVLPALAAPAAALADLAVTPLFRPRHLLECVWRC